MGVHGMLDLNGLYMWFSGPIEVKREVLEDYGHVIMTVIQKL